MRSGEIDQLLWGRKIDNTTGRAADVISKPCSWFVAGGVLEGVSLRSPPPYHSLLPAFPVYLGISDGWLTVREYSIAAERGMPCVVARHRSSLWAVLHRGQVVPCVFGRVCPEASRGHGHTTPETVVSGMSGRRTGSVYARDRCDREE